MKSQYQKFTKVSNQNIPSILKSLDLTSKELMILLECWVQQGLLKNNHPIFLKLSKFEKEQEKNLRFKEESRRYRELRYKGVPHNNTLDLVQCSPEQLEKYRVNLFQYLSKHGSSPDEICTLLFTTPQEFIDIENYKAKRKEAQEMARKEKLLVNQHYAKKHLLDLKEDIKNEIGNYLIFDIEATQHPDEIIEISIINLHGDIILDQLIQPDHSINWRISKLTGITNDMVSNKPTIFQIMPVLEKIVDNKIMLSWGNDYDKILLSQAMSMTDVNLNCSFGCAQHIYMGLINSYNQVALHTAAQSEVQSHRALDDCNMVLSVLKNSILSVDL